MDCLQLLPAQKAELISRNRDHTALKAEILTLWPLAKKKCLQTPDLDSPIKWWCWCQIANTLRRW